MVESEAQARLHSRPASRAWNAVIVHLDPRKMVDICEARYSYLEPPKIDYNLLIADAL